MSSASESDNAVTSGQRDSRVLVFSQRRLARSLWNVTQYEFEDVVCGLDDVDLLAPPPVVREQTSRVGRRIGNVAATRLRKGPSCLPWDLPQIPRTPVTGDHDLFFAVFHYASQLPYLRRLTGWRKRSRRTACMIVEMWKVDLVRYSSFLDELVEFDVVYLLNPLLVPKLRERGIDARFLPTGVDALAFSPLPHVPERSIDVYSYGRRSEVTHRALLELAAREGATYLYDTTSKGDVLDNREHRALLANLLKRSEFFIAYALNDSADRDQDVEQNFSTRYFEGAAGGTILLGSRPRFPEFDECFDWDDAVMSIPYECHGIGDLLAYLRGQPERLARARHENVRNSLLRHDWSERWRRVLADAGLGLPTAWHRRRGELERQAEALSPELLAGPPVQQHHRRQTAAGPLPAAGGESVVAPRRHS